MKIAIKDVTSEELEMSVENGVIYICDISTDHTVSFPVREIEQFETALTSLIEANESLNPTKAA